MKRAAGSALFLLAACASAPSPPPASEPERALARLLAAPDGAAQTDLLALHAGLSAQDPAAATRARNLAMDAGLLAADRACIRAFQSQERRNDAVQLGADLAGLAAAAGARARDARSLHAAAGFLAGAAARLDTGEPSGARQAALAAALMQARAAAARCKALDTTAFSLADALAFTDRVGALCMAALDPKSARLPAWQPDCP